jgi:LemA protein
MSKRSLTLIIILGVFLLTFLLALVFGISSYNGLVKADQEVKKVWGNVETQYQRRTDLYSGVIKTIEGSANFEKTTLKEVLQARASATQIKVDINDPATLAKYQAAQGQLQSSFGRLMAVAEAYPDLKTTKAFQDFQTQQEGTENRIGVSRKDYNEAVEKYNLFVKVFPRNIFANMFGYKEKGYYQAAAGSENAPDIKFDIK